MCWDPYGQAKMAKTYPGLLGITYERRTAVRGGTLVEQPITDVQNQNSTSGHLRWKENKVWGYLGLLIR